MRNKHTCVMEEKHSSGADPGTKYREQVKGGCQEVRSGWGGGGRSR